MCVCVVFHMLSLLPSVWLCLQKVLLSPTGLHFMTCSTDALPHILTPAERNGTQQLVHVVNLHSSSKSVAFRSVHTSDAACSLMHV